MPPQSRHRKKSFVTRAQVGLPVVERDTKNVENTIEEAVPEIGEGSQRSNQEGEVVVRETGVPDVEKEMEVEKTNQEGEEDALEALENIRDNLKKKKRKGGVSRKSDMNPKKKKKKKKKKITADERESPAPTPVEEVPKKKKSEKKKDAEKKKKKRMGDDRVESSAPPPPVVENEEEEEDNGDDTVESLAPPPPVVENEEEEEDNGDERESPATERESPPANGSSPPHIEDDYEWPMDADDEPTAEKPQGMYFPSSEYNKKIKISAKCHIDEVLTTFNDLEHPLTDGEWDWFRNHPQFKHVFHMSKEKNHKAAGMWLLFLRTAKIEKKKEVWFVVNGVPIRYSIREHALISGFDCRNYPLGFDKLGSKSFVNKYFKDEKVIRRDDVREKLKEMVPRGRSHDRLKMAVLYFLSSVVVAPKKAGEKATGVDDLFLRIVSDLSLCETFPWGRYSFDCMLGSIAKTMRHFDGFVKKENAVWPISGFCLPMELLPFEAIQALKDKFISANPSPGVSCPRMCKIKFKECDSKGYPLESLYHELGKTQDIASFLAPQDDEEESLLAGITEEEDDDDVHDPVIASWMERLRHSYTVRFEEMYNEDVESRGEPENAENLENVVDEGNPTLMDIFNTFKAEMEKNMNTLAGKIEGRVDVLEERIKPLEEFMKTQVNAEPEAMDSEGNIETEADNAHQQVTSTTTAGEPQVNAAPQAMDTEREPQVRAEPAAPQTIPRRMTRSRAAALNI